MVRRPILPPGPGSTAWPDRADAMLAAASAVAGVSSAVLVSRSPGEPSLSPAAAAVLVLTAVPLLARRPYPAVAWALCGLAAAVYGVADWPDPFAPFGPMLALATVFERCPPRVRLGCLAVSVLAVAAGTGAAGDADALDWWTAALALALPPVAGSYLRARSELETELRARAERSDQARQRAVADARRAERDRVARDLHDILAHHVTVLIVQAEAAASVAHMDDRERQTRFDELAADGRAAVGELRRLLGALRTSGRNPEHDRGAGSAMAPQPGLAQIDELVDRAAQAGLVVTTTVQGERRTLPAMLDLAAYRVIQEGLTNVLRHSQAGAATLTIGFEPHRLVIELLNEHVPGGNGGDGGLGLVGLRERVELAGGELWAGPLAAEPGRFRLAAALPTAEGGP